MKLDEVQNKLDYETSKRGTVQKAKLSRTESEAQKNFDNIKAKPKSSRYLVYLTILTFLFFIATVGIAFFISLSGIDNQYSPEKILLLTEAPSTIDSANTVPINIRIVNRNPISLNRVYLTVIYPKGVTGTSHQGTPIQREEFTLGDLHVNESRRVTVKPSVYGVANENKVLRYELEYRAGGSQQSIKTIREYSFAVRNAPVSLSPITHTTPIAGKEMHISFDAQTSIPQNVQNLSVEIQHPSGFTPTNISNRSDATSTKQSTTWKVPVLERGQKRTFAISGIVHDTESPDRSVVVRVFIGPENTIEEKTLVAEKNETFAVESSFLDIDFEFNRQVADTFVVQPGQRIRGKVLWRNTDIDQLEDVVISLDFAGTGLNQSSINAPHGYFDEIRNRLVWDTKSIPEFEIVPINSNGSLNFSFDILPNRPEFTQKDKNIQLVVSASAYRVSESRNEEITSINTTDLLVQSVLQVSASTLFNTGALVNSGPLPPTVGKRTSYSLQYFLKNAGSDVSEIQLIIPLAREAQYSGKYTGVSANEIQFNQEDNTITVSLDSLDAYGSGSSRAIEIQVVIEPTSKYIGNTMLLAASATYSAIDTHTDTKLSGSIKELSTTVTAEPFNRDDTFVVAAD